jgi:hypothetical protein
VRERDDKTIRAFRDDVLAHIATGGWLVDVRSPGEYRGSRSPAHVRSRRTSSSPVSGPEGVTAAWLGPAPIRMALMLVPESQQVGGRGGRIPWFNRAISEFLDVWAGDQWTDERVKADRRRARRGGRAVP